MKLPFGSSAVASLLACVFLFLPRQVAAQEAAAGAPRIDLFAPVRLIPIEITLPTEAWEKLRNEHQDVISILTVPSKAFAPASPYSKFSATVMIDGHTIRSARVRKKGFLGSASNTRPSLNLEFEADGKAILGCGRITLNNNQQDSSRLRQYLAYRLFNNAGIPASRCNFAKVRVNGKDLGIYTLLEPVKAEFLNRNFADANGSLYEGRLSDFLPEWVNTFEKKSPKNRADRSDLNELVDDLQRNEGGLEETLRKHLDLDEFYTFWAMEVLIGHWDGYSGNANNFFIYRPSAGSKFRFIPWGADAVLGSPDPFTLYAKPESVSLQSSLPRRLYQNAQTREQYRGRFRKLLETVWNESELLKEIDRLERIVRPALQIPTWMFDQDLSVLRTYVKERRNALAPELNGPAPVFNFTARESPVLQRIGKISASFNSHWVQLPSENPFTNGTARCEFVRDGKAVRLEAVGVDAGGNNDPATFGEPCVNLILKTAEGPLIVIAISIAPERFTKGEEIPLDCFAAAGYSVEFPFGLKLPKLTGILSGRLILTEAKNIPGSPLAGTLTADVFNWKYSRQAK